MVLSSMSPPAAAQGAYTTATSDEFTILAAGPIAPDRADTVLVIFSASVDPVSATDPANYTLNGHADFITAVRAEGAPHLVYLTFKPGKTLSLGAPSYVRVFNVTDAQGRALSAAGRTSNVFYYEDFGRATAHILRCQLPDGAIAMGHATDTWIAGQDLWIVPYFGQETLFGLLDAYTLAPDERYLTATRSFLNWYASQMRADGTVTDYTGSYPTYTSTGTYDSSDSYAAGHIRLLWYYYQLTRDQDFVQSLYPSVNKAIAAIQLTLQSDWLTWAKPDYLVKYTMDNAEVVLGLEDAAKLALLVGDNTHAATWNTMANNVRNAIESNLYLGDALGRYAIGKFANGSLATGWSVYYPDGMAQCCMINLLLNPAELRSDALWTKTLSLVAPAGFPMPELDFQFAWSAIRMNDARMRDVGYVMMQKNSNRYSTDSGMLLRFMRLTRRSSAAHSSWIYD